MLLVQLLAPRALFACFLTPLFGLARLWGRPGLQILTDATLFPVSLVYSFAQTHEHLVGHNALLSNISYIIYAQTHKHLVGHNALL